MHSTSSRCIPCELSPCTATFSFAMGCQKLGQPVPDSNLVLESKRTVLQQMQVYSPSAWLLAYLPVTGHLGAGLARHLELFRRQLLLPFGLEAFPLFPPRPRRSGCRMASNSTIRTSCFLPDEAKADKVPDSHAAGKAGAQALQEQPPRAISARIENGHYLPPFTSSGNSARRFVSLGKSL